MITAAGIKIVYFTASFVVERRERKNIRIFKGDRSED